MSNQTNHGKTLTVSILSLSLLTVMAGAAVAPALSVIQAHFADTNQFFVQMIISVPALFIVITNFIFPKLCKLFGAKTLVLIGLLFYTAGGCAAGLFDNIFLVLVMRALVGIGVGIIMPLSTGLLSYYFKPEQQVGLMGYSSAMNQMGGVIATLLSGLLANISWRVSFLVYLMGLISIVLCLIYLPNDKITQEGDKKKTSGGAGVFRNNFLYILAMFLLMSTFFIYPANFAMETVSEGIIPQNYIAVIMAGIPYIMSEASLKAGKAAATTVMPLISAALYLAQFISPVLMSIVTAVFGSTVSHLPYYFAIVLSILFVLCSSLIKSGKTE